ncbi:hypothetical protein KAH94_04290 [bacterium]|nr:hypothetical protein [bacterium]
MSWLVSATDFLLSEWIWNVTWGWHHIPINIFVMIFLLKFFGRIRIMPAVLSAFFSQIFSFLVLTFIAVFLPKYIFGTQAFQQTYFQQTLMDPFLICLCLGAIYFVLNTLFFMLLNLVYKINLRLFILIAFVANGISAFLVYKFWSYSAL